MKTYTSLNQYLLSLPPRTLQELYDHPASCLCVFRDLPELAKHIILRLLFIEQPIHQAMISSWVTKDGQVQHDDVVKIMSSLNLWSEHPGALPTWKLNDLFRKGLKTALLGGGKQWQIVPSTIDTKHAKDVQALDTYAMERWETILHYMVQSKESSQTMEKIGIDTMNTLKEGGLVTDDSDSSSPYITTDGFQFLLMDTSSQVFYFMTQFLEKIVQSKGLNLVQCMTFLIRLSFCSLGTVYTSANFDANFLTLMQSLREFGLVYQRTRKDPRFYPTRLAINLCSGLRDKKKDISKPGFIVVDSNYGVTAYTGSRLQINLLRLFMEGLHVIPSICRGVLTRDSIRSALRVGITASQIISFLTINAYPATKRMVTDGNGRSREQILPPTVVDQIFLWEKERDRFNFKSGVLYDQFLSPNDFEKVRNYAKEIGVLVWDSLPKRAVVVTDEGHDRVRSFWKNYRKSQKS